MVRTVVSPHFFAITQIGTRGRFYVINADAARPPTIPVLAARVDPPRFDRQRTAPVRAVYGVHAPPCGIFPRAPVRGPACGQNGEENGAVQLSGEKIEKKSAFRRLWSKKGASSVLLVVLQPVNVQ